MTPPAEPLSAPGPRRRRGRVAGLVALLAVVVYFAAGVRHVDDTRWVVRDSPWFKVTPVRLDPGWHIVPPLLFRTHAYGKGTQTQPFGEEEPLAFVTPEGARVVGSGRTEYVIDGAQIERLHAECRGAIDSWILSRIRSAVEQVISDPAFSPIDRKRVAEMEEAGARLLGAAAGPAGVSVATFEFTTLGYEGSDLIAAGPRAQVPRKVLWLAVDSFDWTIIDPLIEAGRMPNMKRLVDRGARGNLRAFPPILSPVIWTSVATGVKPEKHGIVDFVATDPETGAVLPVTSTLRRVRAFWNILSEGGVSVGVIAWWASFPAEPVDGFMATDRIAYQLFQGRIREESGDDPLRTYPADLYGRIAPLIVAPESVTDRDVERFIDLPRHAPRFTDDDRERVREFRTVLASARTYTDIGMTLFREHPTDLRVIYFEGPDTASHLFMPFVPPPIPSVPAEKGAWFGGVVPEFYAYQDDLIGRFLDAFADEETTILVTSDHGFRIGEDRPDEDSRIGAGGAARWHEKDGIVLLAGKDIVPGARILGATVLDLVPTLLTLYGLPVGEDMDGKVLTAAFDPAFLADHPARTIATYETRPRRATTRVADLSAGDAKELLEKLESLGYVQQDQPTARVNEGTIQLQAGEYEEAVASFRAALSLMDRDPVRLSLARALRLAGRPDEAAEQIAILRDRGWQPGSVLLEEGLLARDRDDPVAAERILREAAAADPNAVEAPMSLGLIFEQQGRWEDALAAYRDAAARDPRRGEAHNKVGITLERLGRTDEAIAMLNRAIAADPDLAGPYNNLGLIHRKRGANDEARKVIETGLTMSPRSPILLNSLGSLLVDSGDLEGGIAMFEKALDQNPRYAEALSNLAVIASGRGDAKKTIEYLSRLVDIEPDNTEAHTSLAMALLSDRRGAEAIATLDRLLARRPDDLKANIMIGEIHLRDGRPGEALAPLERAVKLDATIPRVWNRLAQCYLALKRPADAERALRRSLAIDPNQPEVSKRLLALDG